MQKMNEEDNKRYQELLKRLNGFKKINPEEYEITDKTLKGKDSTFNETQQEKEKIKNELNDLRTKYDLPKL